MEIGGEVVSVRIQIDRNLVYGETKTEKLTADVYRPLEGESLPPVLLIHGGAFQSGSKEMYTEWGSLLAKAGFVAIAINYRLTTLGNPGWPGVMDDINMAANWIVEKANEWKVEPMKMGIIGDSAGAHLGTLFSFKAMARASFNILACVGVYGVYDLSNPGSEREARMFHRLIGKSLEENPKLYEEASVGNYIKDAETSPTFETDFLLIWGEEDAIATPNHSKNFVNQLEQVGIEVETQIFKDQGHFWFNLTKGMEGCTLEDYPNTEVAPKIVDFLKEKLSPTLIGKISGKQVDMLISISNQKV